MGIFHMMGQCAVHPGDWRGWIPGARVVGGIDANRRHPGQFFYDDAVMGLQLLEQAGFVGIAKFVVIGTACAYLKFMPVPFQGADLWEVFPEETNAPYGLAKKMFFIQAQAYRQGNTLNATSPVPVNLNGPGDNFDAETSPCHAGAHQKMPRDRGGRLGRGRSVRHRSIWG